MNRTTQKKHTKKSSNVKISNKKVQKNKQLIINCSTATKKINQNIFTKTFNASTVAGNNSVLTQRNTSCSKSKVCSINPQSEHNTVRMRSSVKKLAKVLTNVKTQRKKDDSKPKAIELDHLVQKKGKIKQKTLPRKSLNEKNKFTRAQSANPSAMNSSYNTGSFQQPFKKVQINTNIIKINQIMKQGTQKIAQIKQYSDFSIISQMQKAQKVLMNKIQSLQNQNTTQINLNNNKFQEIQSQHNNQINQFKEQIKFLNLKVDQHNNRNITLEKKQQWYQKQITLLTNQNQQKEIKITKLFSQNQTIKSQKKLLQIKLINYQNQHNLIIKQLKTYENNVNQLQLNVQNLKSAKKSLEHQLLKCQKQKQFIKENSQHILTILNQQFGDDLSFLK